MLYPDLSISLRANKRLTSSINMVILRFSSTYLKGDRLAIYTKGRTGAKLNVQDFFCYSA